MTLPVESIQSRLLTVPAVSFPRTIDKIDRISSHPQVTTAVIGSVVASDPMLTALILGRANGLSQADLTQISNAVMMLGVTMVRGVIREAMPIPENDRKMIAECWALANATATMTKILARHAPVVKMIGTDEETLHAIGLLHDLGTVAAILYFPREYEAATNRLRAGESDFNALLRDVLGVSGPDLGFILGMTWNLPSLITTCIRYHQRPGKADEYGELVALVHVARALVRACGFCAGADVFLDPIFEPALKAIGVFPGDFEAVIAEFFDEMEELELYEWALVAPSA